MEKQNMVYTHVIQPQKGMKIVRVIVQMCLRNRMASESQTSHTTGCLIPSTPDVQDKTIHTDRKQMRARERGNGESCLMGIEFLPGMTKKFWNGQRRWLYNAVDMVSITKLFTRKW